MGWPYITFGTVDYLQDLYVNKNAWVDKHYSCDYDLKYCMGESLFFAMSADPQTAQRRKALSGAFFKSRLIGISKIIKSVALAQIKKVQLGGEREINLQEFTRDL